MRERDNGRDGARQRVHKKVRERDRLRKCAGEVWWFFASSLLLLLLLVPGQSEGKTIFPLFLTLSLSLPFSLFSFIPPPPPFVELFPNPENRQGPAGGAQGAGVRVGKEHG